MNSAARVDILMPTYNAAPWLDDFMESLLKQDFSDWRLIVRDDASSDDTLGRLSEWQVRIGDRMIVLPDDGLGNLGVCGNFTKLIGASKAPWIMLADPDDVWLEGKMLRMARAISEEEARAGASTPIAITTDALVVDADLRPLHASYWKSVWVGPRRNSNCPQAAMESPALSSAMVINRALAELASPIPPGATYQDWWIALVAAAFGKLIALPGHTILYRQHGKNLSGEVKSTNLTSALRAALGEPHRIRERLRAEIVKTSRQAQVFVARFRGDLSVRDAAALDALASLGHGLGGRLAIIRHRLWYSTIPRNVRIMLFL